MELNERVASLEATVNAVQKTGDTTLLLIQKIDKKLDKIDTRDDTQNNRISALETDHGKVKNDVTWIKRIGKFVVLGGGGGGVVTALWTWITSK